MGRIGGLREQKQCKAGRSRATTNPRNKGLTPANDSSGVNMNTCMPRNQACCELLVHKKSSQG